MFFFPWSFCLSSNFRFLPRNVAILIRKLVFTILEKLWTNFRVKNFLQHFIKYFLLFFLELKLFHMEFKFFRNIFSVVCPLWIHKKWQAKNFSLPTKQAPIVNSSYFELMKNASFSNDTLIEITAIIGDTQNGKRRKKNRQKSYNTG